MFLCLFKDHTKVLRGGFSVSSRITIFPVSVVKVTTKITLVLPQIHIAGQLLIDELGLDYEAKLGETLKTGSTKVPGFIHKTVATATGGRTLVNGGLVNYFLASLNQLHAGREAPDRRYTSYVLCPASWTEPDFRIGS